MNQKQKQNNKNEFGIEKKILQNQNNRDLPLDPFKKTKSFKKSGRNQIQQNNSELKRNNQNRTPLPKKLTRIGKAKQSLFKCLNQVTDYQGQKKQLVNNNDCDKQRDYKLHNFNPISKLTSKPFIRSKTCDQIRKQHSKKKQRKRANSVLKYNTPLTNNTNGQNTQIRKQKNSSQIVTFKNIEFKQDNDILQFSLGTNKKQRNSVNVNKYMLTPKMNKYQNIVVQYEDNIDNKQIFGLREDQSIKIIDSYFNNNQIMTDLQMTNKILQQKLHIKNSQIQQLSKNYNILKNQMYQVKYLKSHQSNSLSNSSMVKNTQITNIKNQFYDKQQNKNDLIDYHYISSPKFNDQFYSVGSKQQIFQHLPLSNQPIGKGGLFQYKNKKRKQLFSSDLSQKVSQQFENEDMFTNCKDYFGQNSRLKYSMPKKYSHQYTISQGNNKKQSFILSLKQQIQDQQRLKNQQQNTPKQLQLQQQIQRTDSFLLQYTPKVPQLSMNQSLNFSQDSRLIFTSKKQNEQNKKQNESKNMIEIQQKGQKKIDIFSYYHTTFLNSSTKPLSSGIYIDRMKTQFKLTPQKDVQKDNKQQRQKQQVQQQEQGLFSKALSGNKHQQINIYQIKQLPQCTNILRRYNNGRKSNIQLNFINKCIQNVNQSQITVESLKEKPLRYDTIIQNIYENS